MTPPFSGCVLYYACSTSVEYLTTSQLTCRLYACDIRLIFELAMVQEWSPLSILSISMHVQCYNYSIVFGNGIIPHEKRACENRLTRKTHN